ncbi:hypothetical protein KY307_03825 [Candidatus Woesearchaeota archaeon]|nr:hypothetical protein [Candidatus Woesearchaeota archaeon]
MRIKDWLMHIVFYLVLGSGAFGFGSGCANSRNLNIPVYRVGAKFIRLTPEQVKEATKRIYSEIYGDISLKEFFNQTMHTIRAGQR